MKRSLPLIALVLSLVAPLAAQAQTAAPDCSAVTAPALPPGWSNFLQPEDVATAAKAADQPEIQLGHAYSATLVPAAQAEYVVAPKMVTPDSFGGLLMLTIDKAGVYSVGISDKIWVDIIRDGQALRPVAHQEGAPCSAIRKTVDFQLDPGHYTLQLSNAPDGMATVEVIAK